MTTPSTTTPKEVHYLTKNVTIDNFEGKVRDGLLDAGAGVWLRRLKIQIVLAEKANNTPWPDHVKTTLLTSRLSGDAAEWLFNNFDDLGALDFDALGEALCAKYRCRLTDMDVTAQILHMSKKPEETYAEYARHLRQMAATSNQGIESTTTKEKALDGFVKTVWPQKREALIGQVRRNSGRPDEQLETAIEYLTQIAGNDERRRLTVHPPRAMNPGKPSRDPPATTGKRVGGSTPDQRPAKVQRRDFSDRFCETCKKYGHNTWYHPIWKKQQRQKGAARLAEDTTSKGEGDEEKAPSTSEPREEE